MVSSSHFRAFPVHQDLRCHHQRKEKCQKVKVLVPIISPMISEYLTLCILETPKRVLLQTVKTQMKSSIMLHFIRVYTVCKGKKDLQAIEYNIFLNCYLTFLDMHNGLSRVYCIKPKGIIH